MMLPPLPAMLIAAMALPQTPNIRSPNQLPLQVRKSIVALHAQCKDFGGVPGKSPQLVKVADLNGDGITDYVIDNASYDCDGAVSAMSNGQSGAGVEVLVGGPGNTATPAYENSVYAATIETVGGKSTLWLDLAGVPCGQTNAARIPFSNWKSCSRALAWNATTRKFVLAPLSQARAPR